MSKQMTLGTGLEKYSKTTRREKFLAEMGGGLLLVPQFTLAADTWKGMRPSLTPAADPGAGEGCSPISASAPGRAIRWLILADGQGVPCHGAMAAQPRGDLATSGPYSASKYGEPKAPLAESTEDLPHPSLRRPEKTNATPPLFTASPEIRLNFFLKLPKKVIAALPAAPTPLKRLRRLPSPPWVYKMDPSPPIVSTVDCGRSKRKQSVKVVPALD
jgi:hypothetical protein